MFSSQVGTAEVERETQTPSESPRLGRHIEEGGQQNWWCSKASWTCSFMSPWSSARFLKKNLTDWHESSHCCCHIITCSREDKSVICRIIILWNFFCDILYVRKSHQNHAIHLKSLSDTLNLCYFECIFMWYEHVYDMYLGRMKRRWHEKPGIPRNLNDSTRNLNVSTQNSNDSTRNSNVSTRDIRVSRIEDRGESFEFQVTVNLHLVGTVNVNP